jgi:mannose-6-phosphate isomerase-like protein (cupin superfamily)
MSRFKRYVVGRNDAGKSAVLMDEPHNIQSEAGHFWRATLWGADQVPVDNTVGGDQADGRHLREPPVGGMLFRMLEIYPDNPDREYQKQRVRELHKNVKQKYPPTEHDLERHPSMHRTDTLDCICVISGEMYLVTDVEEVLMRPGDTVVIRGTNHGWSNRSDKPCLSVGCMISAMPLT